MRTGHDPSFNFPGKYTLDGSRRRRCIGGELDGIEPTCEGLNQLHNYSDTVAPTILLRHQNGHIAQSNDGKLVVTPGTIVHMECLSIRKKGNPSWQIKNYSGRTYPQVGKNKEAWEENAVLLFFC